MLDNKDLKWFQRNNLTPPSSVSHGLTPDEIGSKVKPLKPHSWRLEGNRLIAKTEMGELVNYISTDYILTGIDKDGLPVLTKIKV